MGVRGKRERPTRRMVKAEVRWRGLVADHRASGAGLDEFCRERGINKVVFYKWPLRKNLWVPLGAEPPLLHTDCILPLI